MAAGVDGVPFSPVLLAGLALRPVPLWVLQKLTSFVFCRLLHRHPDLAIRLEEIGESTALIDPTDLPYCFRLFIGTKLPQLAISRKDVIASAKIPTIRGTTGALLSLLEGNLDGDALFFSRSVSISGDVEVFVALRNAIDCSDIDLITDMAIATPVAKRIFGPLVLWLRRLSVTLSNDLATLQSAMTFPATSVIAEQAVSLKDQRRRIEASEQAVRKLSTRLDRALEKAK